MDYISNPIPLIQLCLSPSEINLVPLIDFKNDEYFTMEFSDPSSMTEK